MPLDAAVPVSASLATLLAVFSPLFTAPSFRTFTGLACGFLAQSGKRTVCGILTGAGLSRLWPHDRAHYFFSRARWNPDELGISAWKLVIGLLVPGGEPVELLIDDTLFRRRGRRVWPASWFHDGSAAACENGLREQLGGARGPGPAAHDLPACRHSGHGEAGDQGHHVRLPAVAGPPHGHPALARPARPPDQRHRGLRLRPRGAERPAGRRDLDDQAARQRRALRAPPGAHRRKGRPRKKGERLPSLARIAAAAEFSQVTVTRYGKTETIAAAAVTCLWYYVTGTSSVSVTVILIRDTKKTGHDLALITTQENPDTAQVIERYAARWAIEVAIEDAKQIFGAGQARNRTAAAVERTIPFQLACQALAICWYATAGHHPADIHARRRNAPWYTAKTEPSTEDMTTKIRRVLIVGKFKRLHADQPEPAEIHAIRLA